MRLYFENADGSGSRYDVSNNLNFTWSDFRWDEFVRRQTYKPRFGRDGSVETGDGRVESRGFTIKYQIASGDYEQIIAAGGTDYTDVQQTKDESYRAALSELLSFFRPEKKPFYLIDTDALGGTGLRCQIGFKSNLDDPVEGNILMVADGTLKIESINGMWEDIDWISVADTGELESGDTLTIDNTGPESTWPYFEFTASNNVQSLTIRNETNGQFFTFSNTSFGAGSVLVVDATGEEFRVTLDDISTATSMTDGSGPVQLEPGENVLKFESPTGVVTYDIKYRRRYQL